MSSTERDGDPVVVYSSRSRVVVVWKSMVMELEGSGASGWIRTSGAGGPMSGELVATAEDGVWSRPLEEGEVRMFDLALKNPRQ
ncbi:hypothetical protein OIU34_18010 [Pararhizobium sp. BT-229]|uniref:hypothetical protein n=1 Tax=Pararhizobium sp. BT-229 TaxID=2986923 RepID=UPI0021F7BD52|nr:hypothetical protein [Pararhizobium sp. BT-229]MCV9963774.1 hypothetical protein [Pararhizobium sp. BT-229]